MCRKMDDRPICNSGGFFLATRLGGAEKDKQVIQTTLCVRQSVVTTKNQRWSHKAQKKLVSAGAPTKHGEGWMPWGSRREITTKPSLTGCTELKRRRNFKTKASIITYCIVSVSVLLVLSTYIAESKSRDQVFISSSFLKIYLYK